MAKNFINKKIFNDKKLYKQERFSVITDNEKFYLFIIIIIFFWGGEGILKNPIFMGGSQKNNI